jgi:hypothetical protein
MSDAFVIETAARTAGLAIREGRGFRFYASDHSFQALDNRLFGGIGAIQSAVAAIVRPRRESSDAQH